jgi:hypothetical protein
MLLFGLSESPTFLFSPDGLGFRCLCRVFENVDMNLLQLTAHQLSHPSNYNSTSSHDQRLALQRFHCDVPLTMTNIQAKL